MCSRDPIAQLIDQSDYMLACYPFFHLALYGQNIICQTLVRSLMSKISRIAMFLHIEFSSAEMDNAVVDKES